MPGLVSHCPKLPRAGETLLLPNLLEAWPWPKQINPLYEEVRDASSTWFRSFEIFQDPKGQQRHDIIDLAKFAAFVSPAAGAEFLRFTADYLNCIVWFDEYSDTASPSEIRKTAEAIIQALLTTPASHPPSSDHVGVGLHRDFWGRLVSSMSRPESALSRFITDYQKYLLAVAKEAVDRQDRVIQDVESYFPFRRETIAVKPGLSLLALLLDIPDSVLDHPFIDSATHACLDMILIGNDVYSWNVEQAKGDDSHNILTVVMKQFSFDHISDALQRAAELHQNALEKLLELRDNQPNWDDSIRDRVDYYIQGLADCVTGCDAWSAESIRYGLSKEFVKTREIRVFPSVHRDT